MREYQTTMDELAIDEELETIENRVALFNFPAVSVGHYHIYFNAAARLIVPMEVKKIRIYNTMNYIVFVPADDKDQMAFTVNTTGHAGFQLQLPYKLKGRIPYFGNFQMYKYKDGWCVKKYEPLIER